MPNEINNSVGTLQMATDNYSTIPFITSGNCLSYWPPYFPTEEKMRKAFNVAKALLDSKRVSCAKVSDFIALVEEIEAKL